MESRSSSAYITAEDGRNEINSDYSNWEEGNTGHDEPTNWSHQLKSLNEKMEKLIVKIRRE